MKGKVSLVKGKVSLVTDQYSHIAYWCEPRHVSRPFQHFFPKQAFIVRGTEHVFPRRCLFQRNVLGGAWQLTWRSGEGIEFWTRFCSLLNPPDWILRSGTSDPERAKLKDIPPLLGVTVHFQCEEDFGEGLVAFVGQALRQKKGLVFVSFFFYSLFSIFIVIQKK